MAPIHIYANWNKRSADSDEKVEPYRKYYFICEGQNTEAWYFQNIIDNKKELGIHSLIEICLMEKTGEDEGVSNPKSLFNLAEREKSNPNNGFDAKHDKMIIVFDTDIYQTKPQEFRNFYELAKKEYMLAVTNPSFELFLLLHYKDSLINVIIPEEEKILANEKIGNQRYIAKRFSAISGMNSKKNPKVGTLAKKVDIAIEQEKSINQDAESALGSLTSNIGRIIEQIRNDVG
ncbi:MAG: RloB domain-containing protein [Clostridiales bacterium]|nr:RloB domain-containing protein [Clostridiales bacterium]